MKILLTVLAMIALQCNSIAAESVRTPVQAGATDQATLKLKMISGTAQRRLATINDETFFVGDTRKVVVGSGKITVECLAIGETSATVKCDGAALPVELKIGQSHRLAAANQEPAKTPIVVPEKILELRKQLEKYNFAGMITLGLLMIGHLSFSWSCHQLCRRAGFPSGFWVWLPHFKRIALFKATGVSRFWFFLGLIIPLVGAVAWVNCCIRLCEVYRQSKWWTVLMVLPILGWPVFMYFAWASRAEDNEPAVMRASQGYATW